MDHTKVSPIPDLDEFWTSELMPEWIKPFGDVGLGGIYFACEKMSSVGWGKKADCSGVNVSFQKDVLDSQPPVPQNVKLELGPLQR